jgi:hypothetical protein
MAMDKQAFIATVMVSLLFASSVGLLAVKLAEANPFYPLSTDSDTPKPAVPEFTLNFVDNSYDVPSITVNSTDPNTGITTTITYPSYHAENKSIEMMITNQPMANLRVCYDVAYKDHYSENWTLIDASFQKLLNCSHYADHDIYHYVVENRLHASDSYTTILVFGLDGNTGSDTYNLTIRNVDAGDQVDFQVRAYIAIWTVHKEFKSLTNTTRWFNESARLMYSESDWSPTQTITIPQSSLPPYPSSSPPAEIPTKSPQTPKLEPISTTDGTKENFAPLTIAVAIVTTMAVLGLLVYSVGKKGGSR